MKISLSAESGKGSVIQQAIFSVYIALGKGDRAGLPMIVFTLLWNVSIACTTIVSANNPIS